MPAETERLRRRDAQRLERLIHEDVHLVDIPEKRVPPPNGGHGFRVLSQRRAVPLDPYYLPHIYRNTEMPCVWVD